MTLLLIAAALVGDGALPDMSKVLPDRACVAALERVVVTPHGARPLTHYRRTYWLEDGKIVGVFRREGPPGVDVALEPPSHPRPASPVREVGCDVVTVVYEPEEGRVLEAACEGEA